MISRTLLWTIVGIVTGIYLIGLLLLNKPAATTIWQLSGFAVMVASVVLFAFERFLWRFFRKLPGVRTIFKHPVVHGTWKGTIESSYVYPETGEREGPTEAYLAVRQTYSSIHVELFTSRSPSESLACELKKKSNGRYEIYTIYENKAPSLSRGTSPIHHGGMMLKVVGDPARALEGSYWTDRETHGVLKGDKYSQDVYDRFEDASKGTY